MQRDAEGKQYYVDGATGEVTRIHPADATFKHTFIVAKWGGMQNGDYLVLLIEHVKSRHIVDCVSDAQLKARAAPIRRITTTHCPPSAIPPRHSACLSFDSSRCTCIA